MPTPATGTPVHSDAPHPRGYYESAHNFDQLNTVRFFSATSMVLRIEVPVRLVDGLRPLFDLLLEEACRAEEETRAHPTTLQLHGVSRP